jgi:hypothetical protein
MNDLCLYRHRYRKVEMIYEESDPCGAPRRRGLRLSWFGLGAGDQSLPLVRGGCAGETAPAEECIFDSFDQCRQTVRGVGGFCYMNPSLQEPRAQVDPAYPVPRPARRHR